MGRKKQAKIINTVLQNCFWDTLELLDSGVGLYINFGNITESSNHRDIQLKFEREILEIRNSYKFVKMRLIPFLRCNQYLHKYIDRPASKIKLSPARTLQYRPKNI